MTFTPEDSAWFASTFSAMVDNVERVVLGKRHVIELAFTAMVAEGHLLLEDFPGTGKTSLARAMSQTVQGVSSRIQFTPDLLPGDVTGITVYDQKKGEFEFHHGPIFANIVLADEINRASPKTQSALLEAMEEGKVTVDGVTRSTGSPFLVIATQNPIEQAGTYRLPEAQLDRFLMRTSLGYPDEASTVKLLSEASYKNRSDAVGALITGQAVADMSRLAANVHTDPSILTYISQIADATRRMPEVMLGLSVRGAMAYTRASKTWAAAVGRNFVLPDDVKELAIPVLSHRIILDPEAEFNGATVSSVINRVLDEVAPPADRAA